MGAEELEQQCVVGLDLCPWKVMTAMVEFDETRMCNLLGNQLALAPTPTIESHDLECRGKGGDLCHPPASAVPPRSASRAFIVGSARAGLISLSVIRENAPCVHMGRLKGSLGSRIDRGQHEVAP